MAERMSSGDLTAGEVRFIRESRLDPTLIAKQMRMSPEEIVLIKERKLRNDVDSPTPMQEAIARVSAEESSRQTNSSHIEVVETFGQVVWTIYLVWSILAGAWIWLSYLDAGTRSYDGITGISVGDSLHLLNMAVIYIGIPFLILTAGNEVGRRHRVRKEMN